MSRFKTFDSTGLATAGRLYAGDLNAIQDLYADLFNLAQSAGVSSLAVGEVGLQLLHYGSGEARLSGAMRTDGILRGLGGLFAGAFTTAARNAIASGLRPFTLIIFNTDTNRFEYNAGTDASPNWQPLSPSLGANSITATELADNAVDTAAIQALAVTAAKIANATITDIQVAASNKDGVAGTPSMRSLGTGAQQAAAGNDPRLSDTRVPTDGSVSTAKLQSNAVTDDKMAVKMRAGTSVGINTGGADISVSFATPFPSACDGVSVSSMTPNTQNWTPRLTGITASGFTFHADGSNADQAIHYSYVAVGH